MLTWEEAIERAIASAESADGALDPHVMDLLIRRSEMWLHIATEIRTDKWRRTVMTNRGNHAQQS